MIQMGHHFGVKIVTTNLKVQEIWKNTWLHSYQKLLFKCEECNFWGPNEHTMKMHVKRRHSETISCGMCNFEANQIETLDTHTFPCEIYKCNEYEISFLHLDELAMHMKNYYHGSVNLFKHQLINHEFLTQLSFCKWAFQ